MPEGSLGRVYAQRMLADGLDPDVIRRNAAAAALEPGESDLARKARYLTRRRTMTHDIHHTVTGFGTDLPGEVGVSAVYLAQIHQPVSLLYLCAVLLHTMPEPELYGRARTACRKGCRWAGRPATCWRSAGRWGGGGRWMSGGSSWGSSRRGLDWGGQGSDFRALRPRRARTETPALP
jgi:hypothetical protein